MNILVYDGAFVFGAISKMVSQLFLFIRMYSELEAVPPSYSLEEFPSA